MILKRSLILTIVAALCFSDLAICAETDLTLNAREHSQVAKDFRAYIYPTVVNGPERFADGYQGYTIGELTSNSPITESVAPFHSNEERWMHAELCRSVIIVAKAIDQKATLTFDKHLIVTRTAFAPTEIIFNPNNIKIEPRIKTIQLGGDVSDSTGKYRVARRGFQQFTVGRSYVLIAQRFKDDGTHVSDFLPINHRIEIGDEHINVDKGTWGPLLTGMSLANAISELNRIRTASACSVIRN